MWGSLLFSTISALFLFHFLQIVPCLYAILQNSSHFRASYHLLTIATRSYSFTQGTFAYLAQSAAVKSLHPIHATTLAVDMFWKNGNVIQLRP